MRRMSHSSLATRASPLRVVDMGSGKGYLTFPSRALSEMPRPSRSSKPGASVDLCKIRWPATTNSRRVSRSRGRFPPLRRTLRVLIALHAVTPRRTMPARGIAAGARLLVVAPCCQKETTPAAHTPAGAGRRVRHGIFQERQAESSPRVACATARMGPVYRTKSRIHSTEHTAKKPDDAAIKTASRRQPRRCCEQATEGIRQILRHCRQRRPNTSTSSFVGHLTAQGESRVGENLRRSSPRVGPCAAIVAAPPTPIEFSGRVTADGKTKLALTDKATAITQWLEAGEEFRGYGSPLLCDGGSRVRQEGGHEIRLALASPKSSALPARVRCTRCAASARQRRRDPPRTRFAPISDTRRARSPYHTEKESSSSRSPISSGPTRATGISPIAR